MGNLTVQQVASYFVNHDNCNFPNSFDGNMKLQKLIVFANLIHLAKHGKLLFSEEMFAFKNGIVVEEVRKPYQHDYYGYINELKKSQPLIEGEELESLNTSVDLFSNVSAKELSDLHHELQTWQYKYNKSKFGDYHFKDLSKISKKDIFETDIKKIKKIIASYERNKEDKFLFETVNGITFYYDPHEMDLSVGQERLLSILEAFSREIQPGEEDTFFITYDEEQGIYYY